MQYRSIVFFVSFILLAIIGSTDLKVSGQDSSTFPPQPADLADRFGVYNWGVDYSAYPENSSVDRLNWGADKIAEIGSRTIRVAMPGDVYQVGLMSDDPAQG